MTGCCDTCRRRLGADQKLSYMFDLPCCNFVQRGIED